LWEVVTTRSDQNSIGNRKMEAETIRAKGTGAKKILRKFLTVANIMAGALKGRVNAKRIARRRRGFTNESLKNDYIDYNREGLAKTLNTGGG